MAAPGPRSNTGAVTWTDTAVSAGQTYSYRVKAVSAAGSSAYSSIATVTLPLVPAAPSAFGVGAGRANGNKDTITLMWMDNSNNETGFTIQRATNNTFTTGLTTIAVTPNATSWMETGMPRGATYYYRIRSDTRPAVRSG